MLPLDPTWSLLRYAERVERLSNAVDAGMSLGLTADEEAARRDFYAAGEWFLLNRGPVDIAVVNASHESGKLIFDVVWRCLSCGETDDIDRPPDEDGRQAQDDFICRCRKCDTVIGKWGDQRKVAEWLAEEEIRYGNLKPLIPITGPAGQASKSLHKQLSRSLTSSAANIVLGKYR